MPCLEQLCERISPYNLFGAGVSWPVNTIGEVHVSYSFADTPPAGAKMQIHEALSIWSSSAPIYFNQVDTNGQINIYFGKSISNLAESYPPGQNDLAGDVFFSSGAVRNLLSNATHELGHALGLNHSDVREAVMHLYADQSEATLHADDIAGIQALYGVGVGSVSQLRTEEPVPPPEMPYVGFLGEVQRASADLDSDGIKDSVFMAAGSQGHVKAFLGSTGEQYMNLLAFKGFNGTCAMEAEEDRVVVAALLPQYTHVRGYVGGVEVASVIVSDPPVARGYSK
jgi:hypothetical protein